MKHFILAFFLFAVTFFSVVAPVNSVLASGEVQIATQSNVMYLTTTTVGGSIATTSATPLPPLNGTPIPFAHGTILLPPGFFPSASDLVNRLLRLIMVVAVILVFVYLVWGGLQYIMSGGEKSKTEAARNKIISAIVGLVILASSYAILTIVLNFIGFRDVNGFLQVAPPSPTPIVTPGVTPMPTPTPNSLLQQLIK